MGIYPGTFQPPEKYKPGPTLSSIHICFPIYFVMHTFVTLFLCIAAYNLLLARSSGIIAKHFVFADVPQFIERCNDTSSKKNYKLVFTLFS